MNQTTHAVPRWIKITLLAAGCYNLLWGAGMILWPEESLQAIGYSTAGAGPMFWQGTGLLVGVFGVGYAVAATDPTRHWLVVFIGLISKVLAGLGCVAGAIQGTMPPAAGWLALPNDLLWWGPFALILWFVFQQEREKSLRPCSGNSP